MTINNSKKSRKLFDITLFITLSVVLVSCNDGSSSSGPVAVPPVGSPAHNLGIPSGAPPAAYDQVPMLPSHVAWPFKDGAPRTSGTGRYAHGAYYWSDFLYDANGAQVSGPQAYRIGTPTSGSFTYPADTPTAYGNGADIFRVGIGADRLSTYWRVDWLTLVDEGVPIAAFGLDIGPGGISADEAWPGVPNLHSEGVDKVLLLAREGATLLDSSGDIVWEGEVVVDAGGFVVELPRTVLSPGPEDSWLIRLAAGLNDGSGQFRNTPEEFGGYQGLPPVFNMAFRDYEDEPSSSWFEETQAVRLREGDVSDFSVTLEWGRLGETEEEVVRQGYSSRWYVSSLAPTDLQAISSEPLFEERKWQPGGIYTNPDDAVFAIPQYFDQVQPYGLYVPKKTTPENGKWPLTWMLHSFTQNHNQYAGLPNFQREACEERGSVCVTTLGRGPAGYYLQDAETDLWDVWQEVAGILPLDPDRTISSGYSMGALGTFRMLIRYPDVFAAGVILAGQQQSDIQPSVSSQGGSIECNAVGGTQLENIKWNDYYHAHGSFDQLIPFPEARLTVDEIKRLQYRYVFDHFLAEDHIVWTMKDTNYSAFATAADWMKNVAQQYRKKNPGEIIYRWCLDDDYRGDSLHASNDLGVGPVGPWWIGDLQAADGSLSTARVRALSAGNPEPVISVEFSDHTPLFDVSESPAMRETQTWSLGEKPAAGGLVQLELNNVSQISINMEEAGVASRLDKALCIQSDNAVLVILKGLGKSIRAGLNGSDMFTSGGGDISIMVPAGSSAISFSDSPQSSCPSS